MLRKYFVIIFIGVIPCFTVFTNSCMGQDIKLTILDSVNKIPLPNTTIKFVSLSQTTPEISGVSKINGTYVFTNVKMGKFEIDISHIGYKAQKSVVDNDGKNNKPLATLIY
jgi:hypothetical protein